jgi:hypothetical protein
MMDWLTEDAVVVCDHQAGIVANAPSQSLVHIDGRRVLVEPDPVGRTIDGCPWVSPGQKKCMITLSLATGYSTHITIDGKCVSLDTVVGPTDGTPPGAFQYTVRRAGQALVSED